MARGRFNYMNYVTGATGFIGKHLVESLMVNGSHLYALSRSDALSATLPEGVTICRGDITEALTLPKDVTTIYHCAGAISQSSQMERVNVLGTQRVVAAALAGGCRLIHLSSAGVVGRTSSDLIDEQTACHPHNLYEQTKYEAERIVLQAAAKGLKAQILRPTIVFGSGRAPEQDSFLHLIRAMAAGRYRSIGSGRGIYNIVHVHEVARAMQLLDSDRIPNGGVYIINDPLSFNELARIVLSTSSEKRVAPSSIPYPIAFSAAAAMSLLTKLTGKRMPLTLSRLQALTNSKVFSQALLETATGYRPEFTVSEYVAHCCHDYSANGLLDL